MLTVATLSRSQRYYLKNKEKVKAKRRAFYWANKDKASAYAREWGAKNRERKLANLNRWKLNNPGRSAELNRRWIEENRRRYNAIKAARKKRVKQATPPWVDVGAIFLIYENCPDGYHVDHIMPIRGKSSCGLHVPWNLQYLTAEENMKKGNRECH